MTTPHFYPVGTPGQPWGDAERAQWRARQVRQRSYADDVLAAVDYLLGAVGTTGQVLHLGNGMATALKRS